MDYSNSAILDLYFTTDNSKGIPSEFSNDATTEASSKEDLLSGTDDDYEGIPSESSINPASNASAVPSSAEDVLSASGDDLEGSPTKSSIGHCSDVPTEPDADTEEYALGIRQPIGPATTRRLTTTVRKNYTYRQPPVCYFPAAQAAVFTKSPHPAGIPNGLADRTLPPSKEQEGIPSCSEPRPPASPTSRPAATTTTDFEQQLTRILSFFAKRKQDVTIHIAADQSSAQRAQLLSRQGIAATVLENARHLHEKAVAAEDEWLQHLAAVADDPAAYAATRRRYDNFCKEYGLYSNLGRVRELVAMHQDVFSQTQRHCLRLSELPSAQKNDAFTIVGKMPPVKLYQLPGIPGNSVLPGSKV